VPGWPRLASTARNVGTEHFAERFLLFVIIALGETIVITGAATSDFGLGSARLAAFGMAFLTIAALWWP
jgi:low temperature requirement protein LtrA